MQNSMKTTPKQYALALYDVIKDKKNSEIKPLIKEFVNLMVQNNDITKSDKIINEFVKVYNQEQGIVEAEIKSARALDSSVIKSLKKYIKEITKTKDVEVGQIEDKSLMGGVVIKHGDKILDASLKTKLRQLKENIVK